MIQQRSHLVLVGLAGAGKSTLAKNLAVLTGARVIEIGEIVRLDAASCRSCESPLDHAIHIRQERAECRFVAMATARAQCLTGPSIIVGPRAPEEICFIRQGLPAILVIALLASDDVRHQRRLRQQGTSGVISLAMLQRRDAIERSWGINETLAMSDLRIDTLGKSEVLARAVIDLWPGV